MAVNKIVVALSGSGRTLRNLLEKGNEKGFKVVGVISSKETVYGVQIAREAGLPVYYEKFLPSEKASESLSQWLRDLSPDMIVLAGFLKIFPTSFADGVSYQTLNIHPSLLPNHSGKGMYGDRVHAAVLAQGDTFSGASVHFVNEVYDEGPLLAQVKVPVFKEDTVETLASRVFDAECELYPAVIEKILKKSLPPKERPWVMTLEKTFSTENKKKAC